MRVRLAGGGGGGKEAKCMRPTGKTESPGRGFPSRGGARRPRRGSGCLVPLPEGGFFFFSPDSAEESHWGLGSRTHPDPGENQRSSWGDPVATS